jgi:hypothetical protein
MVLLVGAEDVESALIAFFESQTCEASRIGPNL